MGDNIWDIFIAHAGADLTAAEELYDLLQGHCKVYLDSYHLLPGDDWDRELATAQRNSLITLVLVSSHTEEAYYQRDEIAAAISMARKDKESHRVVPIYLDDQCHDSVPGLRLKHGLYVSKAGGLSGVVHHLSELVAQLREKFGVVVDKRKQSILFELRSQKTFSFFENRMDVHLVSERLARSVNLKAIHIIASERNPHRVQIESSVDVYHRLYNSFLTGELDKTTGVNWTSISNLTSERIGATPEQTPLIFCDDYEQDVTGAAVVCHMATIGGFEAEANEARGFVGESTKDPQECRIYITKQGGHLYAHSNYVKQGCIWPTKIATENKVSLFTLFYNIFFVREPTLKEWQDAQTIHTTMTQYFINQEKILREEDVSFYCGAMNIEFVTVSE